MASPLRPDQDETGRSYKDPERARLEHREAGNRTAAAAGFAWWWIFWIAIIVLAIWWAGWGWGGTGGWWWGGRTRTAPTHGTAAPAAGTANTAPANTNSDHSAGNANQAAISGPGLAVLNATNKQYFVGKQFQINDVPVQKKVNDQVLWIGAKHTTPMLLVLAGNGNSAANAHIDEGSLISATGTVQKAPPRSQAKNQWRLSGGDADRLDTEGAYIETTQAYAVQKQKQ
jgi:hypothetical protein